VNQTAKQQLKRNVCPLCYATPAKTYTVPAVENPDGTINIPAQPVFGIDPNHEPIDGYMATRQIPGGVVRDYSYSGGIGASGRGPAVPAGKRWKIMQVSSDVTASATVGNRTIQGLVSDGTTTLWIGPLTAAIAAAQVGAYDIMFGCGTPNTTVRRNLAATALCNVAVREACGITELGPGAFINIVDVAAIDIADTINIKVTYVEYDN